MSSHGLAALGFIVLMGFGAGLIWGLQGAGVACFGLGCLGVFYLIFGGDDHE